MLEFLFGKYRCTIFESDVYNLLNCNFTTCLCTPQCCDTCGQYFCSCDGACGRVQIMTWFLPVCGCWGPMSSCGLYVLLFSRFLSSGKSGCLCVNVNRFLVLKRYCVYVFVLNYTHSITDFFFRCIDPMQIWLPFFMHLSFKSQIVFVVVFTCSSSEIYIFFFIMEQRQ